jgi:hypothetical protein
MSPEHRAAPLPAMDHYALGCVVRARHRRPPFIRKTQSFMRTCRRRHEHTAVAGVELPAEDRGLLDALSKADERAVAFATLSRSHARRRLSGSEERIVRLLRLRRARRRGRSTPSGGAIGPSAGPRRAGAARHAHGRDGRRGSHGRRLRGLERPGHRHRGGGGGHGPAAGGVPKGEPRSDRARDGDGRGPRKQRSRPAT